MKESSFIAVDIGAGSGRVMLGTLNEENIRLQEIHRFDNKMIKVNSHFYWNILYLFDEIKIGLRKCSVEANNILSIGIDTWGVDFGFLSKEGDILGNPYAYRDPRTNDIMPFVFKKISKRKIYELTGIQLLQFNSIYQIYSMIKEESTLLNAANKILFIPDILNYLLTGKIFSEYTIATTSQLLNVRTKNWDYEIFEKLNIPKDLFPEIIFPTATIGKLTVENEFETNLKNINLIAVGSHDTASAVSAVPAAEKNFAYLSSGTWSLVGIETNTPIINEDSYNYGFTNEGGADGTFRFLKNTMGLWIYEQSIKKWKNENEKINHDELIAGAKTAMPFLSIIDPDDPTFLNPSDMIEAIKDYCIKTKQSIPNNQFQIVRTIFESLSLKYRFLIDKINSLTQKPIEVLHIVGGGSQNCLLNQFTANALGIKVIAGPVEATAVGNIIVQAMSVGLLNNLSNARSIINNSFNLSVYYPEDNKSWQSAYKKALALYSLNLESDSFN